MWRPLKGPVDESPLALVDAQTLQPGDLLSNRLELQHRTGYTYSVKHDPGTLSGLLHMGVMLCVMTQLRPKFAVVLTFELSNVKVQLYGAVHAKESSAVPSHVTCQAVVSIE